MTIKHYIGTERIWLKNLLEWIFSVLASQKRNTSSCVLNDWVAGGIKREMLAEKMKAKDLLVFFNFLDLGNVTSKKSQENYSPQRKFNLFSGVFSRFCCKI